jgi:hypothetical protein
MAFRAQITIGALLIGALGFASAQPFSFEVRHGTLRITDASISFEDKKHSSEWKYVDIQQLSLSPDRLRLLTYEDQRWKPGLDREYVFDHLPPHMADQLYTFFRSKMGQRFIEERADVAFTPLWKTDVKLRHGRGGTQGTLLVGEDRVAYLTQSPGESRTWLYTDIDNVSSSGSFELTLMTLERSGWTRSTPREFRFQLKEPLPDARYNDLWRRLNSSKGLATFSEK